MKNKITFFIIIVLSITTAFSQNNLKNLGSPFIQNYTAKEYKAATQNWCIRQTENGILYVGNNDGVLEYDGVSWRKILVSNNSVVRSIEIDSSQNIYIGASNEFGFLKPNKIGKLEYHSLKPFLSPSKDILTDVWQIICTKEYIIYRAGEGMILIPYFNLQEDSLQIDTSKIKIIKPKKRFLQAFYLHEILYVTDLSFGLLNLSGDSLIQAKNGDYFKKRYIFSMLPYSKDTLIAGIYRKGLFLYNYKTGDAKKLESEANQIFAENRLYSGALSGSNAFAFSTLGAGVIIVDKKGNIIQKIDKKNGLKDNVVGSIYNQAGMGLWLATNTAISKVEVDIANYVLEREKWNSKHY